MLGLKDHSYRKFKFLVANDMALMLLILVQNLSIIIGFKIVITQQEPVSVVIVVGMIVFLQLCFLIGALSNLYSNIKYGNPQKLRKSSFKYSNTSAFSHC